jgi:nucleotide-binding universal stress UspA family protein
VWTGGDGANWIELLEEEAEATREEAAAMLAGRAGSARVVKGRPVPVLREARDEADATLVALGGRHSSRLLGIVLGDTVTESLHDRRCSVLVARPPDPGAWQPRTLVAGVDGSPSSLAGLACADDIAARLGGRVEVVASDEAAALEEDWTERADRRPDAEPVAALLERAREADLVVVGSRSLHGLRALGSVSERVAHRASCSVLVVHAADRP